jgi:2-hydroxychromene-2-carboxylate isomerase
MSDASDAAAVAGTPAPVEFWFDFSSPYAFFAAREIDAVAARHGRSVTWRPFLLGVAFRTTRMAPLTEQPMRGDYGRRDWDRLGRLKDIPFRFPTVFPVSGVAATRMFYAIERTDPAAARRFAAAAFDAVFVHDRDVSTPAVAAEAGAAVGLDAEALVAAAADPEVKDLTRERVDEAMARGIFGAPFFVADGEPFWGWDRLPMLDEWLARGGW